MKDYIKAGQGFTLPVSACSPYKGREVEAIYIACFEQCSDVKTFFHDFLNIDSYK